MKYLTLFISLCCLSVISCNSNSNANLEEERPAIKTSEVEVEKATMIHNVYFWYKEDLSKENIEIFHKAVKKLGSVPSIHSYHYGPAAPTAERGVVDNSYDMALNVFFKDVEAQNEYQVDPIHLGFVEECKDFWKKVVVYDNMLQ